VNLPIFIAKRYFLSKRKKNFINFISVLSMIGVAFATAALIVVLSVFNGLEGLLRSLNTSFDPQIKIEATKGKSFLFTDSLANKIKSVEGVDIITEVIEDYVYIRYSQRQESPRDDGQTEDGHYQTSKVEAEMVVTMKGVSNNFIDQHRLDERIMEGEMKLESNHLPGAIIGKGIRNTLSISIEKDFEPLRIYYVKNLSAGSLNPANMYAQQNVFPLGVFSIEKNYDDNYIIVPLATAKELMNYGDKRTSLDIKLKDGVDVSKSQLELKEVLGQTFQVLNNDEQHSDLYRIFKMEKLFFAMAFSILMAIASINIFFSLMMLVIDKKKDISILASMGAGPTLIQRVFISEAFVISGIGAMVGLASGALLCWLQQEVGMVGLGMEHSVVLNYPVKIIFSDFLLVAAIIFIITIATAWIPSRAAAKSAEARVL
jgi:lipoprotein-releasing system permease protein